jgi:biopolymer transport protein ExbD
MNASLRSRRMRRNHRRLAQQPKLNLVALMDIFTILVLFLMVNNGDVEVLQPDQNISLPESLSEQRPELALIIKVTADDILVEGRSIQGTGAALAQPETSLQALAGELQNRTPRNTDLSRRERELGRAVIIMGDRGTPYKLLKRIMTTCAESGYRDISLAVNSTPAAPVEQSPLASNGA